MIPCVGASGFISGVIACYAICFPKVRLSFMILVRSLAVVFVTGRNWLAIPAWCVFAIWIILQIVMAVVDDAHMGGVAYMAHIGGFLPGIVFAIYHRRSQKKAYQRWTESFENLEKSRD